MSNSRLKRKAGRAMAVACLSLTSAACVPSAPTPSGTGTAATASGAAATAPTISTPAAPIVPSAPGTGSTPAAPAGSATTSVGASAGPPVMLVPTPVVPCHPAARGAVNAQPTTGVIYYDSDQNGQQDHYEPGLAGIPVYLAYGRGATTPAEERSPATCTDGNGAFSLTPPDLTNHYRLFVRTGWFRTQCPTLTCEVGSAGNNVETGAEWIRSAESVTGAVGRVYKVGLIPDAGQHVESIRSKSYIGYPPDLSQAHEVDLAARFTDDPATGCLTTTNGVDCRLGGPIAQTLYIGNSGMSPVTGVHAVMQLPYGEVHRELALLKSGTSPGVKSISKITVVPAKAPAPPGAMKTAANFTTITFTIDGVIPPAGFVSVLSKDILAHGAVHTQITGWAGVTAHDSSAQDHDSAFCSTPGVPTGCEPINQTHSLTDLHGDNSDSNRFNIVG